MNSISLVLKKAVTRNKWVLTSTYIPQVDFDKSSEIDGLLTQCYVDPSWNTSVIFKINWNDFQLQKKFQYVWNFELIKIYVLCYLIADQKKICDFVYIGVIRPLMTFVCEIDYVDIDETSNLIKLDCLQSIWSSLHKCWVSGCDVMCFELKSTWFNVEID